MDTTLVQAILKEFGDAIDGGMALLKDNPKDPELTASLQAQIDALDIFNQHLEDALENNNINNV